MEVVVIMLLGAILNGLLASSKGRTVPLWVLLGATFPLISLLILVLLDDLKEDSKMSKKLAEAEHKLRLAEIASTKEGTKECPFCAETIKSAAKLCRFCGKDIQIG